jgi:phage baseplate assembly protein W
MADAQLERETVRRRLLGWSAACEPILPGVDHGRDLVLSGGGGAPLDLARVESVDCLGQSLSIALTTALGSDIFNTGFGFDGLTAMVQETEPVLVRERVRISVVQVLRSEPRVRRILDVDLGDDRLRATAPGQALLPSGERPAASRTLEVSVQFETIAAEPATITLGSVTPGG